MALKKILYLLLLMLVAAGAWLAGESNGRNKMEHFCGVLIDGVSAKIRSDELKLQMRALDTLEADNIEDTKNTLQFLARVNAEAVRGCRANAECSKAPVRPLVEEHIVQRALTFKH